MAVAHRGSSAIGSSAEVARETADAIRGIGSSAETFDADLLDPAATLDLAARVEARFGRVDLLVHNASQFHPTPLADTAAGDLTEQADRFHAIHVRAPLLLVHALLPGMRARGGGSVVLLGDANLGAARAGFAPYAASKAGLEELARVLAAELAPAVRVNAVAPGAILPPEGPAARPVPLRGAPEDVAEAVWFLATGPAALTGQVLAVGL